MKPVISIIMGSTSDLKIMEQAAKFLDQMEIPFEINALSAHRTPDQVAEFAKGAAARGIKVIIAGAGGAAHLPGVIAASTTLPVIGVPIKSSNSVDGWDSMLSILQMPSGIPVQQWLWMEPRMRQYLPHRCLPSPMRQLRPKLRHSRRNLPRRLRRQTRSSPR